MSTELWQWTAAELAAAISTGRISSVEATESAIARMDAVNPAINAVVDTMPDVALAEARSADEALRKHGPHGPLHGVPMTVKVNVDYQGRATTNGVVANKHHRAESDSSTVAALRAGGLPIFGRTNTPAYSMRAFTSNDLHGATLNPHDPAITCGGSSGGAGSAVAAGIGAIAHGNDIGGSVRHPAYCCGVYGLRPTSGLVPQTSLSMPERKIVSQLMAVQGALARSVEDLRLAMQVMSRPDPNDIWQVPAGDIFGPMSHRPCKVAVVAETDESPVDPEVAAAIRQAADMLADAGYEVAEVPAPSFRELVDHWRLILGNEMRGGLGLLMEAHGDWKMKRMLRVQLEGVPVIDTRDGMLDAIAHRSRLVRKWQLFLESWPLVLTAVSWAKPMVDDLDVADDLDIEWFYQVCAPYMGTPTIGLPGLTVPVGTVPGKPMGVQLLATRFGDRRLIAAGAVLERAIGRIVPVDPIAASV
ncbi:Amidase [Rhizobium sp. CF080]|uniref:amidase n=1 Tax=Rhizobium sp. (strain CF080) TaxID=1144310 RepID=UPI000271C567|nr:amidase [Rhizobium sp. CF080]EUB99403.1 Amidase [Rhizobium sp. CF080]